jgi:hypothetical protein
MDAEAMKVAEKESQVVSQLSNLASSVSVLCELVPDLEGRLVDVSISEPECNVKEDTKEDLLVPMATGIRSESRKISAMNARLKSMIRRLEL